MELRWGLRWGTLASCLVLTLAIPSSLVEEIKATEMRNNKVKRAHPQLNNGEERGRDIPYFNRPTAIKRGTTNLKNPPPDQQSLNEWEQEQRLYQTPDSLANVQSGLFNPESPYDDKTIAEYEKGFNYGTNREKLDEALENAVLKSELYGDPSPLNQYRYYSGEERRKRRRRDVRKARLSSRIKRETDLTPEEILTILSLYENEHPSYRPWSFEPESSDPVLEDAGPDDDENWLDAPVYPHAAPRTDPSPSYLYEERPFEKRGRWNGFADKRKRFMVAKRSRTQQDPTRELRYLNGPNKNDYYTLSQLLSNQREPNVPLYHRLVL